MTGAASEAPGGARAAREVVFAFAYMDLEGVLRRGHPFAQDRFALALLDDDAIKPLIADAYRSYASRVRHFFRPSPLGDRSVTGPNRYRPLRLARKDPTSLAAIRKAYARYDAGLERAARACGMTAPAVITTHPLVAGFCELAWAEAVTFYVTDDWRAYPRNAKWWPAYTEAFERVARDGLRVCAVSQPLIDRIRPTGPHAVVPNGIEPADWLAEAPAPPWLDECRRPVGVYVGTVDERIDVEAVRRIGESEALGTVLVVGPVFDEPTAESLRGIRGVRLVGAQTRQQVIGLLRATDVGLVPHVTTQLTSAMSPLKLYEYLAAGLPVAAADLAPMRGVHDGVQIADSPEGFVAAVRTALERGRMAEAERRAWIARNSWSARHRRVLDVALHR